MFKNGRVLVLVLALAGTLFLGGSQALAQNAQSSTTTLIDPNTGLPIAIPISMFLVPDGTGTPFTNCFQFGGAPISVEVKVVLNSAAGPVGGVPVDRIRLEEMATAPTVAWCSDLFYPPPAHAPNLADMPTDIMGTTKFTMAYHGGGWAVQPTYVWLLELPSGIWSPLSSTPLPISYNSPDINGDLRVDLSDISIFAFDYFGAYDYRSDFNYDGVLNLTDLAMFAPEIGAACP